MYSELQVLDYVVIVTALVLSSAAGLYYGVYKKKNDSTEEYFFASREMSTFKMACSYFATVCSSNTMIGNVAETYYYGSQGILGIFMFVLAQYINLKILFPVIFKIGSLDIYKFYELKYGAHIRYFLSTITLIERILMGSIIIYGTGIVLSKVSGIDIWIIIIVVTAFCVIYSSMGGVRGVTIADVIQTSFIIVPILAVFIAGIICVGGLSVAWERNWESGRIELFNFDFDPTIRHTFWTSTIASLISSIIFTCNNPTIVLRVMATNSFKKCERAVYYGSILFLVTCFICMGIGLLIYSLYYLCDPLVSGAIADANQLISMFVSDTASFSGYQGLFYAAVLCASISTLSSMFNGLSALAIETFVRPFNLVSSDQSYTRLAKISVVVIGILGLIGTVIVPKFSNVYQASIVLFFSAGPQFGLFLIGIIFPQASVKSCIGGYTFGVVFMLWVLVGSLLVKFPNKIKPISIAGCITGFNATTELATNSTLSLITNDSSQVIGLGANLTGTSPLNSTIAPQIAESSNHWDTYFPLSSASFNWFMAMGVVVTFASFALLSFIFGTEKKRPVNVNLIPEPVQNLHKKLNKKWRKVFFCDVYDEVSEMTAMQSERLIEGNHPRNVDREEGAVSNLKNDQEAK